MGTRSVIAIPQGDGWRGRYVHWDGYPQAKVSDYHTLVNRDGVDKVLSVMTDEHYGWSSVDPARGDEDLDSGRDDGRFVVVPGYGIAYTTEQGQSSPDEWITHDGDDCGTEWCYVLSERGMAVLERVYADEIDEEHAVGMFGMDNDGAVWRQRMFVRWTDELPDLDLDT